MIIGFYHCLAKVSSKQSFAAYAAADSYFFQSRKESAFIFENAKNALVRLKRSAWRRQSRSAQVECSFYSISLKKLYKLGCQLRLTPAHRTIKLFFAAATARQPLWLSACLRGFLDGAVY
jgi:hypothetical protein